MEHGYDQRWERLQLQGHSKLGTHRFQRLTDNMAN